MVENDFTGKNFFLNFFCKSDPKKGCGLGPKTPKIFQIFFLYQVPNRNIKSDEISASHDRF